MHISTLFTSLLQLLLVIASYPTSRLTYKTVWTPGLPAYIPGQNLTFTSSTFTLLLGPKSAILVDVPLTTSATNDLARWLKSHLGPRTLTHVYITHGHADHAFGLPVLQQHFPGVRGLATPGTIAHIQQQLEPASFDGLWKKYFPGDQIADQNHTLALIDAVPVGGAFQLDGHVLRAVEVGQGDTDHATVLYVPELGLVVAGDVVYGRAYQYLGDDTTLELRRAWLRAVDVVEGLKPTTIVSSHRQEEDNFVAAERLRSTREYLKAWEQELAKSETAHELVGRMQKRFPERVGEFILQLSANSTLPAAL